MTSAGCATPILDPSTNAVNINITYAQFSCRAGYKYFAGDFERLCDGNGTWSGQKLLCTVDSILPKAYLVLLIVGATIAAFLACIPYDFYRFRKRKKKVRDHQERLSLVTRIAPNHATVILDGSIETNKVSPQVPRRFGLKSLFSVFRFVGAKMKTSGDSLDTATHPEESGKGTIYGGGGGGAGSGGGGNCSSSSNRSGGGGFGDDNKDTEVEPDSATASTLIFSPHHSNSCPAADSGVIDVYAGFKDDDDDDDGEVDLNKHSPMNTDDFKERFLRDDTRSKKSFRSLSRQLNDKVRDNNDQYHIPGDAIQEQCAKSKTSDMGSNSSSQSKTDLLIFQSERFDTTNAKIPSSDESPVSEPATVEVTSMNETASSSPEQNAGGSPPTVAPKMVSPTSSASSPDVASSCKKGDTKDDGYRTFHFQTEGCSNMAYHSMPAISDAP